MSRGTSMKTPERVAEAIRMRSGGARLCEIAEHFGVALTTVHAWISDPDGSAMRARKDSYAQPCMDCGAWVSGQAGRRVEPRCWSCAIAHRDDKVWTRDALILAIQEWAFQHGHPPTQCHWGASSNGKPSKYHEEFLRDHEASLIPWFTTVVREFGNWGNAIVAAGYDRPRVGRAPQEGRLRKKVARGAERAAA